MTTIYIGNKNYSSWSLRAWLMLKRCAIPFAEEVIPLDQRDTAARIRQHSPSGRVPAVRFDDDLVVWDTLAIAETLAERYPQAALWPSDARTRAMARAVSAEMHSGFTALRRELPMNLRAKRRVDASPAARGDIEHIQQIWQRCRTQYKANGPWLFGAWSIADAMYAPVATRFVTYRIALTRTAQDYVDTTCEDVAMCEWTEAALREKETIDADEAGTPIA